MENLEKYLEIAKQAAVAAGEKILEVYGSSDFNVELKDDDSPLTKADSAAHLKICEFLEKTSLPILSEEGREIPFDVRKDWELFWMVDPLDGTKEFIKRNGEFTVNIALIGNGTPVLGVVYVPVTHKLYYAWKGNGSFLESDGQKASLVANKISLDDQNLRVVASRSHLNAETSTFLESLKEPQVVSMGSSLKLLAISEGTADLYPRFAPTMEWDTAAAQIVVEESGAQVLQRDRKSPVMYNKEDLTNPHFIVLNTTEN